MTKLGKSKNASLRSIAKRVPDKMDLFPKVFDTDELLRATDRTLSRSRNSDFAIWFLKQCARRISGANPELAAQIMERVGKAVLLKFGGNAQDEHWTDNYDEAAEYWLSAKNSEERLNCTIEAAALATRSVGQMALFSLGDRKSFRPLWQIAEDLFMTDKFIEAAHAYRKLSKEYELRGESEDAAIAALWSGRSYSRSREWKEAEDQFRFAYNNIGSDEEQRAFRIEILTNLGIAMLKVHRRLKAFESLELFDAAKDLMESDESCMRAYSELTYSWLGFTCRVCAEILFSDWAACDNPTLLAESENAALRSQKYFEALEHWRTAELAETYAMLNSIYLSQNKKELAEEYLQKAMLLGFDLSEE